MKIKAVKIAVLFFAALTVVFRFLLYKYDTVFSLQTVGALRIGSYIAAGLLLLCGVLWTVLEKKK
ncbi:MAG: hypothetical protein IJT27_09490 [Clostridia bacterium]|nr:hypothetical protein [Clostridia bacterium]